MELRDLYDGERRIIEKIGDIKLTPLKDYINDKLYKMYQDIPEKNRFYK